MSPRDAADLEWPLSEVMQVSGLPPVWSLVEASSCLNCQVWRLRTFVAQTVTIGEQKVCPESESLKFSTTPTPQVENPYDSDSSTPTPQPCSALHSPIRSASKRQLILKRTMTLTPNRIDTRISLRCQVVVLFHRAACVERGNCPTTNDNLDIWFLVILLQLLCSALIQLIETTQLLRLVFYA